MVADALSTSLALVLLVAAIAKASDITGLESTLVALVPSGLWSYRLHSRLAAQVVICVEALMAVLLLVAPSSGVAPGVALSCLLLFCIFFLCVVRARRLAVSCSCFGRSSAAASGRSLYRSAILLSYAAALTPLSFHGRRGMGIGSLTVTDAALALGLITLSWLPSLTAVAYAAVTDSAGRLVSASTPTHSALLITRAAPDKHLADHPGASTRRSFLRRLAALTTIALAGTAATAAVASADAGTAVGPAVTVNCDVEFDNCYDCCLSRSVCQDCCLRCFELCEDGVLCGSGSCYKCWKA